MFSVITNIYNKKTKVPTLMELFTATENLSQLKLLHFFSSIVILIPNGKLSP